MSGGAGASGGTGGGGSTPSLRTQFENFVTYLESKQGTIG